MTARGALAGAVSKGLRRMGYVPVDPVVVDGALDADIGACQPFTMTSRERMLALSRAVCYVVDAGIPGDMVECGVWKGGSALLIARTLLRLGDVERDLWLYDTFAGMTAPTAEDESPITGADAGTTWREWQSKQQGDRNEWAYASVDQVAATMRQCDYPPSRVHLVQGAVEDTIPAQVPDAVAVLRLDTDWYESTRHELVHLWPRLAVGGVMIVDDYGWWGGARKAVDEFFADTPVLLHRIDNTGVTIQKTH